MRMHLLMRACASAPLLLLLAATSCAGQSHHRSSTGAPTPRSSIPARLAAGCDRYASPRGHDRWRGGRHHPFRTVKRLIRSLKSGRTGCLAPGRYHHSGVAELARPATTLRSLRGRRANVDGTIWIAPEATGARIRRIRLTTHDPTYSIPLKIQADRASVTGSSITGSVSTNCILVGSYREARGVVIARNRIGHCGRVDKFDHLIYVSHADGTVIRDNVLFDNRGGWAVHMYPDADNSLVEHNVIDNNLGGVVFAGDGSGSTSDGNQVRNNAITGSGPRWNIEASWSGGPEGSGNSAFHNCLYSPGRPAGGIGDVIGFAVRENAILGRRPYVGRRDYRFRRHSRCASLVGAVATRAGR